jgi:MFS family permease
LIKPYFRRHEREVLPNQTENQAYPKLERFFYGYAVAISGFVIWMIAFGISGTFGIFYKPMMTEFGWNRADTVTAYSICTFMMAILSIVTGWLSDKLGPRFVVTFFGSFFGISFLLMSQMKMLWQFYVIYGIIAATGLSVTSAPVMSTVARWFSRRRGLMTGVVQTGLGIGGLIFVPLAGWLILHYGWRTTYWLLGTIALLGFIISGLALKRDPRDVGQHIDGVKNPHDSDSKSDQQILGGASFSLGHIVSSRAFWRIAWLYAIFGFCRSTFLVHTAAHTQDLGFSLLDASHVTAVLMISSIIGRIGMGKVADAIGNRLAFMISYAATTLSLVWILVTAELWGLYLFAFLFGFGWGAQAVLRFSITAETFGLVSLGLIMGILSIGEAVASALGSYFAGFIFDITSSYRPTFWMGIVLSILGILIAGRSNPVKHSLE